MPDSIPFDFVIIGAGIIGLTAAYELKKQFPVSRIAVLDKEKSPGMHASGRNSGVLHTGIYYGSDTLKAQVCAKGAARMREFSADHGINCLSTGKVIIATSEDDLSTVTRLLENAKANNIRAERLDVKGVKEIEPYANPFRTGIYCPDTAVIDSLAVVRKLHDLLSQKGVEISFDQHVTRVSLITKTVMTRHGRYHFGHLFNCAGANADLIAHQLGVGKQYALLPFKGIYYKLSKKANSLVKNSIYPVPDITQPFLGVHLTRVISGDVYVGPTAIPAFGRENYGVLSGMKLGEGVEIGWRMANMYLRDHQNFRQLVHTEIRKYFKSNFLQATRKLVPDVTADDLVSSKKVGIRPQLVNVHSQKLEMDYIVEQTPTSTHVLNAISPAFTSSFAFAEMLVARLP